MVGTSEDKTLEADALLHRALAYESLVYAHWLSAQELQQFVPFDLPKAQTEGYESLDMARDAIALAAARSSPHMREEFCLLRPSEFPDMDDYMRCEKGDMSLKVRKGKDPHLFLVSKYHADVRHQCGARQGRSPRSGQVPHREPHTEAPAAGRKIIFHH
ncbi:hypothetical protein ARSEF4850_004176 [Beauveria asiatica]